MNNPKPDQFEQNFFSFSFSYSAFTMSRALAIQDLSFYSNGSVFSEDPAVVLVTSTYEVMPTWLVHSLLSLVLGKSKKAEERNPEHIVLISFFDRTPVYHKALLKAGIDLNRKKMQIGGSSYYTHIDLSSHLGSDISVLETMIQKAIKSRPEATTILLESPDLLIPFGRTAEDILDIASLVQSLASNVFFFLNADPELIDSSGGTFGQLESFQMAALLGLLYRSKVSLAMRPLSTGRANDVTGTLTISKGPVCTDDTVCEDSFQYLVTGDAVKLFYR